MHEHHVQNDDLISWNWVKMEPQLRANLLQDDLTWWRTKVFLKGKQVDFDYIYLQLSTEDGSVCDFKDYNCLQRTKYCDRHRFGAHHQPVFADPTSVKLRKHQSQVADNAYVVATRCISSSGQPYCMTRPLTRSFVAFSCSCLRLDHGRCGGCLVDDGRIPAWRRWRERMVTKNLQDQETTRCMMLECPLSNLVTTRTRSQLFWLPLAFVYRVERLILCCLIWS